MEKTNNIELRKKIAALVAAGTILSSIAGCNAKTTTESSSELTTAPTTIETTLEPTSTTVEVTKDMASEDYMVHAKAVAKAMYENNKDYFDEKQYTIEDLENVYYILNGKYYNSEHDLLMDQTAVDRSFEIIRELVMPQRINEMLQKYRDLEHGNITEKDYFDEVNASKFYDYRVSLTNFIDVNEDNKDVRDFISDFSVEMVKVTENVKNGVSPEDHMIEFFAKIRAAQTGDITDYEGINNYLTETTTKPGYSFIVAGSYKSIADLLNTVVDGHYVTVPTKDRGNEDVRVGFTHDEQLLVNAFLEGNLVETDAIIKAKHLLTELFQTHQNDVMCYAYEETMRLVYGIDNEYVKGNSKTYTK